MDKEPLLKVDKVQRESTRKSIHESEKSQNREEFLNFNMVPNTLANRNRRKAKSRSPSSNSPSLKSGRSVK